MVASVELLLDPATDTDVRRQWDALIAAGLPSAGRHTGASNRPHVTLAVAATVPPDRESLIVAAAGGSRLPLPLSLGGLVVFGRGPFVLARQVVVTAELLDLQTDITKAVGAGLPHSTPGSWTPHITLASRLTAADLGRAVELTVGTVVSASAVGVRRWDGDRKVEWIIAGTR